ncbi:MAG TPA: ASKHA domain-containing protein [Planctomycetota bacterium]|nr:ASKHA domain-containing protein [Planctomycetota bacterium]HRR82131.1 ASKHA domain-containing protein [Planctomycetota bacterium]HRT95466.1 ASKHA domain-containing protein [Planctomycetota bacterium]
MTTGAIKVTFEPEGKAAFVLPGSLVLEAAARAGIIVETPCGGRGTCGKCRIVVRDGCSPATATERRLLKPRELAGGLRLACQAKLVRETVVTVPDASRFFEQRILTSGVGGATRLCPAVAKQAVRVPEASLADPRSDVDRALEALGGNGLRFSLGAARELPAALRADGRRLTAVLHGGEVLAVEAGDTAARAFGLALDIGTTTVVGSLLDLTTGHEAALAARTNPQVSFGDDVVARITHASEGNGLRELQEKVVGCINDIVAEVAARAGIAREAIYEVTTVGNTTMNHLLLGLDPRQIAQMPFAAVVRAAMVVPAAELGIAVHPRARLYAMPNIAGFVGGDTVGVILAANLLACRKPTLAVDIGTNGEMVLGTGRRLIACSTAAGPAFEGARIRFGMRAADGAIEQVRFGRDVETSVIGDARPRGLCGSALVDAIAELLRAGILEPSGRMLGPGELPRKLPQALRRRVVPGERGYDFILAHEAETDLGSPILLTQGDIRQVQLAKGAIRAGIEVLKGELGLDDARLDGILLAGGFGNFIRRRNALRIGLLPPVEHARIHFIGNAALVGAKMVLACADYRAQAEVISRETEYLELGGLPEFQSHFAEAMLFPESE